MKTKAAIWTIKDRKYLTPAVILILAILVWAVWFR